MGEIPDERLIEGLLMKPRSEFDRERREAAAREVREAMAGGWKNSSSLGTREICWALRLSGLSSLSKLGGSNDSPSGSWVSNLSISSSWSFLNNLNRPDSGET